MQVQEFKIQTGREGFYDITGQIRRAISDADIESGLCVVYCPHTTAGITINENADPDVRQDMLLGLREAYPDRSAFLHFEGNSSAHLRASTVGLSQTLIVENRRPVLGRWQAVYFCEFDGPRQRSFYVKVIGS